MTSRFDPTDKPATARWISISYGDGLGSPQTRNVWAEDFETARDGGVAAVQELADGRGYDMLLFGVAEGDDDAAMDAVEDMARAAEGDERHRADFVAVPSAAT